MANLPTFRIVGMGLCRVRHRRLRKANLAGAPPLPQTPPRPIEYVIWTRQHEGSTDLSSLIHHHDRKLAIRLHRHHPQRKPTKQPRTGHEDAQRSWDPCASSPGKPIGEFWTSSSFHRWNAQKGGNWLGEPPAGNPRTTGILWTGAPRSGARWSGGRWGDADWSGARWSSALWSSARWSNGWANRRNPLSWSALLQPLLSFPAGRLNSADTAVEKLSDRSS